MVARVRLKPKLYGGRGVVTLDTTQYSFVLCFKVLYSVYTYQWPIGVVQWVAGPRFLINRFLSEVLRPSQV